MNLLAGERPGAEPLSGGLFSYTAYGLHFISTFPLPELRPGGGPEDVRVEWAGPGESRGFTPPPASGECRWTEAHGAGLAWKGVGTFWVRHGSLITVLPAPGGDERLIRLFLLGPVMAVLLHQRGHLVLHAGAIGEDGPCGEGGALAFLGHTGEGKSTLAAAFHHRGYRALTDDLVAVPSGRGPCIPTGSPLLKLSGASAAAVERDPCSLEALPHVPSGRPRYALPIQAANPSRPLPLKHLYVLGRGPDVCIEPLPPGESFMEVLRRCYLSGHLPPAEIRSMFGQVRQLLTEVSVSRLTYPRFYERLPEVVEKVIAHSASVSQRAAQTA